jgi:2,4-dienoyl-CoA reductase-like NADH-dependent reductase (Old Yellow Enzyme family)
MTTRMPRDGAVTEALVAHLSARAAGGAGLIVTEALAACRSAAVPARVAACDEAQMPGLSRLAEAVERQGAALVGQLWHAGNAHRDARALNAVGPSAVVDAASWTVPRALTSGEVEGLVEEYAESAARLQRAGFSGVEISAAHGFLPLQFLSPVTNLRQDRWGGDATGRSAFLRAILAAVRARCGNGFIIGLKVPANDGVPGSIGPDEAARLVTAIVAGVRPDFLCFSQGSHGPSLWMHAPDMHEPPMPFRSAWVPLRAAAGGVPIAAIGRIATPAMAEALLEAGEAELVMLARPRAGEGTGWDGRRDPPLHLLQRLLERDRQGRHHRLQRQPACRHCGRCRPPSTASGGTAPCRGGGQWSGRDAGSGGRGGTRASRHLVES